MKKYKDGTVSIVTLFYNSEKYIARCVRSILEQDYDKIEYVFVNNCSTDASLHILNSLIKEYPHRATNVIIQNNDMNMGFCYSMNKGIELSSGEYLTFVDADDWIEQGAISAYYNFAKGNNYDVCVFDNYIDNGEKSFLRKNMVPEGNNIDYIKAMLNSHLILEGSFWTKLYKTKLLHDINIKMPSIYAPWSDLCFNVQLFTYTNNIGLLQKSYYHYVANDVQLTNIGDNVEKRKQWVKGEIHNLSITSDFLRDKGILELCRPEIDKRKSEFRNDLLYIVNRQQMQEWLSIFPETNDFILNSNYYTYYRRIFYKLIINQHYNIAILYNKMLGYAAKLRTFYRSFSQ